jgi:hypothetical protein
MYIRMYAPLLGMRMPSCYPAFKLVELLLL